MNGEAQNQTFDENIQFADDGADVDCRLIVDVDGFEGPLDLLLALARTHKVDLSRIPMLALAQQYLDFIDEVRLHRLEIAADYLVMAAWLAFLKSKLLVEFDKDDGAGPSGEELAIQLAFRLKRLDAMRQAAKALMERHRLGRDVFARGAPQATSVHRESRYTASLYDLLSAYSQQRQRFRQVETVTIPHRPVWSIKEARQRLERLLGTVLDWAPLDTFLAAYLHEAEDRRSAIASSFSASLEMAREGHIELSQTGPFAPLLIKPRRANRRPLPVAPEEAGRKIVSSPAIDPDN